MPSPIKPGVQTAVKSSIKPAEEGVRRRWVTRAVQGIGRASYSFFAAPSEVLGVEKALEIKLRHMPLAAIAMLGLIYKYGEEKAAIDGEPGRPLRLFLESSLIYPLVTYTKGVFPLLGVATAAYEAGKEPNALEKIKSIVTTASILSTGYLGILMGLGYTMEAVDSELKEMQAQLKGLRQACTPVAKAVKGKTPRKLKAPSLYQIIYQSGNGSKNPQVKILAQRFQRLEKELARYLNAVRLDDGLEHRARNDLRKKADQLLQIIHRRLNSHEGHRAIDPKTWDNIVKAQSSEAATKALQKFRVFLDNSQTGYIRATRWANPIFGYLIAAALIGMPLAKGINHIISNVFPSLRRTKGVTLQDQKPIWLSSGVGQGFGHGRPHYWSAPGGVRMEVPSYFSANTGGGGHH
ncbi:MAG: hypothetical protein K2X01_07995 [Cyanobacteria bacterium]|nr:hypothetical protein [Cyanobacteriota bacterium]